MRHANTATMVAAVTALSSCLVCAQDADFPSKPVRVIVGSVPGGAADIQARIFADKLSETFKRQFVIENRPGPGDMVGTGMLAKSAPDGYTLMSAAPTFTTSPALFPGFPVDPVKDFQPISLVSKAPLLLLVHPSLPAKSVKELIALAKSKPDALNMGVSQGTHVHLASVYFNSLAGVKVTSVPYKGGAQVIVDLLGGQIHMAFQNIIAALPHVKSGRLRPLAISIVERSSLLPNLPTISESGATGYDVSAWNGWVAPAGTPAAIVGKLNAELVRAAKSADVSKKLLEGGGEAIGTTAEQFRAVIAAEVPLWRKVVQEAGIKVE